VRSSRTLALQRTKMKPATVSQMAPASRAFVSTSIGASASALHEAATSASTARRARLRRARKLERMALPSAMPTRNVTKISANACSDEPIAIDSARDQTTS
jgi:hypothetical protein